MTMVSSSPPLFLFISVLEAQLQLKSVRCAVPSLPPPGHAPQALGAWMCVEMATDSLGSTGCWVSGLCRDRSSGTAEKAGSSSLEWDGMADGSVQLFGLVG